MLSSGGGGHGGGGLDEGGGHLGWQGGGACGPSVPNQAHATIDADVGVALGGHVEYLQAIVVQPRQLTLEGSLAVCATDRDGGLGVKYC